MTTLVGKRKILVPIFNRAHYGRLRTVLSAIKNHPGLELQIIVGVPAAYDNFFANIKHSRPRSWLLALPWYVLGRLRSFLGKDYVLKNDFLAKSLLKDGFSVNGYVSFFLDGGNSETMAKSAGLGIIKLVDKLKQLKPDIVFVNADRFEMIAVAVAASYLNVPIAHNEGGDLSGTLDESVRHAITKLAHLHFTSTEASRKRVIQMGENPEFVFNVGSPAIDAVCRLNKNTVSDIDIIDKVGENFLLVLMHPVTTASKEENKTMANVLIRSLDELGMNVVLLGSNIDAGSAELGRIIKEWANQEKKFKVFFTKHLPPDDFYRLLNKSSCAIGNSSSFIREGAYFGTPVVLVGSRQNSRERGDNVIETKMDSSEIITAVKRQLKIGKYPRNTMFGNGNAGNKIADILASVNPDPQKSFNTLSL
ncbi:MAG: UDP-N-acetylglucosamine 2-epimerase [Patescibacteria group bacterium]